ncbi:MAG: ethylbenzene dehydrogenase-related protein [Candidatus Heimdallarchaeota archaeon]
MKKEIQPAGILLLLVGILAVGFYFNGSVAAQTSPDVTAYKVTGPITVDGMTTESFWAEVPTQTFTLSKTPGTKDNYVSSVEVQVAHDGTDIFWKFHWSDSTKSNDKTVGKEDRVALMISMETTPSSAIPCMAANSAMLAGIADEWHWKAARTDSGGANFTYVSRRGITFNLASTEQYGVPPNSAVYSDTSYYKEDWAGNFNLTQLGGQVGDVVYYTSEGLAIASTPGATKLTVASHPHSLADNEFINTTARYHEGDSEYNIMGFLPTFGDRNVITAKGYHDGSTWTVETQRTLAAPDPNYDVDFPTDTEISFAIAVFEGGNEDDHGFKAITSSWKTLTVVSQSVSVTTVPELSSIGLIAIIVASIGIVSSIAARTKKSK